MPNFTAESWASFKQAFLSVIQFIMYCFDLAFDTFRSNPMLYLAFFFPVFALAFFVIFDLVTGIAPFSSLMRSYNGVNTKSLLKAYNGVSGKHSNIKSQNLAVRSMQKRSEASVKAAGIPGSKKSGSSSGSSVNLSGSNNATMGYGKSSPGIDFNSKRHKRARAAAFSIVKSLFSSDETTGTYNSKTKSSGSKNFTYDYSFISGSGSHSELDIEAD